jgi:hypothetical protein
VCFFDPHFLMLSLRVSLFVTTTYTQKKKGQNENMTLEPWHVDNSKQVHVQITVNRFMYKMAAHIVSVSEGFVPLINPVSVFWFLGEIEME